MIFADAKDTVLPEQNPRLIQNPISDTYNTSSVLIATLKLAQSEAVL